MQEPTDQDLARAALAEDLLGANEIGVRLLPIKVESVCLSDLMENLREEVETPRKSKKKKKKSSKIKFTLTPAERKKRNRKRRSK